MNLKFSKQQIPAIIVATGTLIFLGLFIYSAYSGPKSGTGNSNEYYNTKTAIGLISPFQNKEEESQYQKWYIGQRQKGIAESAMQRKQFDHFYNEK